MGAVAIGAAEPEGSWVALLAELRDVNGHIQAGSRNRIKLEIARCVLEAPAEPWPQAAVNVLRSSAKELR